VFDVADNELSIKLAYGFLFKVVSKANKVTACRTFGYVIIRQNVGAIENNHSTSAPRAIRAVCTNVGYGSNNFFPLHFSDCR
jgi:hypothetical protein